MKNNKHNTFETWNIKKQAISQKKHRKHFKERDVVFMSIGENIGFEQNGKGKEFLRPVLIYRKFFSETFLGIPLTSIAKNTRFCTSFSLKKRTSKAILSQIRLFDAKRIIRFYSRLSVENFKKVKQKLIKLLQ